MKKIYNKLCAIAFALLGATSLSAQSWTAPAIGVDLSSTSSSEELYMYNVKADAFACSGMAWGTHALVKELQNGDTKLSADVHRCRVELPSNGQVKIRLNERTYLGGDPGKDNDCWVDFGSNNIFTYTKVSTTDNIYTLTKDGVDLDVSWAHGGHITVGGHGYGNTEWAFIKRTDITNGKYVLYKAKKEMYDIYSRIVDAGYESTFTDELATAQAVYDNANSTAANVNAATKTLIATVYSALSDKFYSANFLFNNPDMRGYGDDTDWGNGLNAFANGIFESWHSAETITQTQKGIPNGFYTIEFVGTYRQDGGDAAPTLTLSSNGKTSSASLKSIAEIDFGNHCSGNNKWTGAAKPDDTYSAGEALGHTDAIVKVENFVVENNELTVTVAMPSGNQWLLCQGFQIYYKAESIEEYANLFNTAKAAAEAINVNTLNTYVANKLTTALTNAENEEVNKVWYQERTAELNAAVTLANETAVPYAKLTELISICQSYSANSTPKGDAKTTFDAAISTAVDIAPTAQTGDALTNAYNALETARQTYVVNATPNEGYPFDLNFKMKTNWDNGSGNYTAGGIVMKERYFDDKYRTGDMMTQTITGLANGIYTVELYANANWTPNRGSIKTAAADAGAEVSSVFANGASVKVPLAHQTSTATAGEYKIENVEVKNGTITFGLRNDAEGANWLLIAPKSLSFVSGFDLTELRNTLSAEIDNAEDIKDEEMNNDVKTALNEAIDKADINSEDPDELDQMIKDLQNAISTAKTSIDAYEKALIYIAKANAINESIAADYQTAYDNRTLAENAETIFQELEVATYNYVRDNFTYAVELSNEWNSKGENTNAKDFNNEHWSGEVRSYKNQNDDNGMGWNASKWSIDFDQEVTLPAGEYVFKVAGRKSAESTLRLVASVGETVLGTVEDFPATNNARGINKAGATSFNADDEAGFANNNNGYGWQWRYVKFELDAESTVKIAVHAETDAIHQWVSFGDYTLQMTEETYLEANQAGLDAVLIPAQALVDSKPMGDTEKAELQTAINMPVTTGAEMLAKIDALTTAVNKANTWVAAYNEAKAPLVTEMDRFESNYNDGVNGCKEKLYMPIWNALITEVGQAAVAKDVTNSYEGFATAKEELTAAIAAVDASIAVYKNFKKEIDNAKAYQLIVKGNQTNYNAAITEAEAIYNNGSEEFPSALAMQNFKVLDYNYVTETYQGVATLDDWSGNWTSTLQSQHYAGNIGVSYYDANTGNNLINTCTITLPAGTYVLSGIGRASSDGGCTTFIKLDDTQVNFPQKGDTGYGVNTSGAADFSEEGEYTNSDKGRGWEYRFIEFTLNEEKEVTLSFGMTRTGGWGSVFTPQLRAKKLTMTDKADFENETKEGYFVSYDREFATGTYTTVMVPFDYELPDGVVAEELNLVSLKNVDNAWISFKEVTTTMTANTPYILKNNSATAALFADLGIKTVYSTASTHSVEVEGATMKGTYKAITATELVKQEDGDIIFVNTDGEGKYIDDEDPANITFPAGRAYIVVNKNTFSTSAGVAPKFTIFHGDDDLNSIEETVNVEVKDDVIYDLAGRRIVKPTKAGIYIVNGKKMIIK